MERVSRKVESGSATEHALTSVRGTYERVFDGRIEQRETKERIDKRLLTALEKYARRAYRIAVIAALASCGVVEHTYQSTRYSITKEERNGLTEFRHEDSETTAILNYLTLGTELPEEFRLSALRSELASMHHRHEQPIPEGVEHFSLQQIRDAYYELYLQDFMGSVGGYFTAERARERAHEMAELYTSKFSREAEFSPSFNPMLHQKLWELQQEVGSPRIRWASQEAAFYNLSGGHEGGVYYDPTTNTIYIQSYSRIRDVVAESAHAYQFHTDPYGTLLQGAQDWLATASDMIRRGDSREDSYGGRYSEPQSVEHDAHSVIEPEFRRRMGLD